MDQLQQMKILIVEDDLIIRMVTKKYFDRLGYIVDCEENGRKAIAYLETTTQLPDLILTDIMMPEMNGEDFLKNIRGQEKYNNIPVFAITAMADEILERKNSGFDQIIQKPFSLPDLAITISNIFEKKYPI
jgi:CheY-like chemotaxis protein